MPSQNITITVAEAHQNQRGTHFVQDSAGNEYRSSQYSHDLPTFEVGQMYAVTYSENGGIRYLNRARHIEMAQGMPHPAEQVMPTPRMAYPTPASSNKSFSGDGRISDKEKNDLMVKMNVNTNSVAFAVAYMELLKATPRYLDGMTANEVLAKLNQVRIETAHDMYEAITGKKGNLGFLDRINPQTLQRGGGILLHEPSEGTARGTQQPEEAPF